MPERVANIYLTNTGWVFWAFWKIISPFVPKRTKEKVCLLYWSFSCSLPPFFFVSTGPSSYVYFTITFSLSQAHSYSLLSWYFCFFSNRSCSLRAKRTGSPCFPLCGTKTKSSLATTERPTMSSNMNLGWNSFKKVGRLSGAFRRKRRESLRRRWRSSRCRSLNNRMTPS